MELLGLLAISSLAALMEKPGLSEAQQEDHQTLVWRNDLEIACGHEGFAQGNACLGPAGAVSGVPEAAVHEYTHLYDGSRLMFRKRDTQESLFGIYYFPPPAKAQRLEVSWAESFRHRPCRSQRREAEAGPSLLV